MTRTSIFLFAAIMAVCLGSTGCGQLQDKTEAQEASVEKATETVAETATETVAEKKTEEPTAPLAIKPIKLNMKTPTGEELATALKLPGFKDREPVPPVVELPAEPDVSTTIPALLPSPVMKYVIVSTYYSEDDKISQLSWKAAFLVIDDGTAFAIPSKFIDTWHTQRRQSIVATGEPSRYTSDDPRIDESVAVSLPQYWEQWDSAGTMATFAPTATGSRETRDDLGRVIVFRVGRYYINKK